ncbi:MAG: S53 family peptidase [Acidobacteriota bacterium]|nr:S53 family peptidase [Acidobacteriota bacterium]
MLRTMPSTIRINVYSVLSLAVFLFAVAASAAATSLPTQHARQAVVSGQAQFRNRMPADQTLRIGILFPVRDKAGLDEFLRQVYNPSSPSYRHFLTVPEFVARFAPTQDDYDGVRDFVRANGMTVAKVYPSRLLLDVTAPVAAIENAFHVQMGFYQHPTENRVFFAPDREPTVDLDVPLWHIGGLDNFSIPRPALAKPSEGQGVANATGSGPSGSYLPSDMRAAYYGSGPLTGAGQCVGLAEFDGYNITDLTGNSNIKGTFDGYATATSNGNNYILTYTPPGGGGPYTIPINNVLVAGGTLTPLPGDTDAAGEVVLDIAQAIGMAPGLSQVRVYVAPDAWTQASPNYNFPANSADYTMFEQMYEDGCSQLSISWNWAPESVTSNDYIFAAMAAAGQNLFAASGDYGSWPNGAYYYPEEDANVVAVGGTDLTTSGPGGSYVSETAWADSGGGISPDHISIPSWQAGIANSSNQASTVYRNAPDVAMEANFDNWVCSFGSCSGGWAGTSFASPRWAGYLALANQQEEASFSKSLGFINPLIYPIGEGAGYSADFHDIASGSNGAYSAVAGYDLVTGWGSPKGASLITAMTGAAPPPPPDFSISVDPTSYYGPTFDNPQFTVTITPLNGYSGYVSLSLSASAPGTVEYDMCSGSPFGGPALYTYIWPNYLTVPGTSTLCAYTTEPGFYYITITGYGSGSQQHQVNVFIDSEG